MKKLSESSFFLVTLLPLAVSVFAVKNKTCLKQSIKNVYKNTVQIHPEPKPESSLFTSFILF